MFRYHHPHRTFVSSPPLPRPNWFTWGQPHQQILSQSIPSSSSSSLHLSLNRKDELHASSPQASLQSLAITSGDLIFFTHNPTAFSSQTLTLIPNSETPLIGDVSVQDHDNSDFREKKIQFLLFFFFFWERKNKYFLDFLIYIYIYIFRTF